MGMDFIGTYCVHPHAKDGEVLDPNDERVRKVISQRIDDLTLDDITNFVDAFANELEEADVIDVENGTIEPANVKSWIRSCYDQAFGRNFSRESSVFYPNAFLTKPILVTGGLSGGDVPTDVFDYIAAVGVAGITDEPI